MEACTRMHRPWIQGTTEWPPSRTCEGGHSDRSPVRYSAPKGRGAVTPCGFAAMGSDQPPPSSQLRSSREGPPSTRSRRTPLPAERLAQEVARDVLGDALQERARV